MTGPEALEEMLYEAAGNVSTLREMVDGLGDLSTAEAKAYAAEIGALFESLLADAYINDNQPGEGLKVLDAAIAKRGAAAGRAAGDPDLAQGGGGGPGVFCPA